MQSGRLVWCLTGGVEYHVYLILISTRPLALLYRASSSTTCQIISGGGPYSRLRHAELRQGKYLARQKVTSSVLFRTNRAPDGAEPRHVRLD